MRFIDELNGKNTQEEAAYIKKEIKRLKKLELTAKNKNLISNLYFKLYQLQFQEDYMCLIIDRPSDYDRANKGFTINGVKYRRLLGTAGGIKNSTIVYVSERLYPQLYERLCCGRDMSKEFMPAKLEAYQALICSGSIPVSMPKGIIVVSDCVTHFKENIIRVDDSSSDEPIVTYEENADIELTESDGYGIMFPTLSYRWARELGSTEEFLSGCNLRGLPWTKGMVFTFDALSFAENVAHSYIVKDAWGDERDIREAELIITTSMLKLWDSYSSWEDYWSNVQKYNYQIAIAKTAPEELDYYRTTNYQFLQNYHLSQEEIQELIKPTIDELQEILGLDYRKTLLFTRGTKMTPETILYDSSTDFAKGLMIEPELINDPYVRDRIYSMIHKKIRQAKIGVLKVRGNFAIIGGDPYSLMQHVFNLPVTGLLKAGECWHLHWHDSGVSEVCCFRAPMTSKYNIRKLNIAYDAEKAYWYKYIKTCMLLNSWDSTAEALNGADKDGDLFFTTNNPVLLKHTQNLPAIYCIQRKGAKCIPTEEDIIKSNKASFGDAIGSTTNVITSQICLQARFPKDSKEYEVLGYRILCGQHYQQTCIDKTKGIIAKPMPRHWYDNSANRIYEEDSQEIKEQKLFNQRICADKKPYFFIYNYTTLMKEYKAYIKESNQNSFREYGMYLDELLSLENPTEKQEEFIRYYYKLYPVNNETCLVNEICWAVEKAFEEPKKVKVPFDYTILKSDAEYTEEQFGLISCEYIAYTKELNNYIRNRASKETIAPEELISQFKTKCYQIVPDGKILCNILLDMLYSNNKSKTFVWEICGDVIIDNLLQKHDNYGMIPVKDPDGEIDYCGERFAMKKVLLKGSELL